MAGLGVLLESQQKTFPKCPQIISKATLFIKKNTTTTTTSSLPPSPLQPTFLDRCYLCRQRLLDGKDIYMYRGDRAFCSEECRCRQIFMDEEGAATDNCSLAAASVSATSRRGGKSRAVGGGLMQGKLKQEQMPRLKLKIYYKEREVPKENTHANKDKWRRVRVKFSYIGQGTAF